MKNFKKGDIVTFLGTDSYKGLSPVSVHLWASELTIGEDYIVTDVLDSTLPSDLEVKVMNWFLPKTFFKLVKSAEEVVSEEYNTHDAQPFLRIAKETVNKALRFNTGKDKWSLVHFASLSPMIKVLEFGAEKYEPHNWKKEMSNEEILESLQRHLAALFDGETHDIESKVHHIGHILANAMFYSYHNIVKDK
jgi:hypothetical protein